MRIRTDSEQVIIDCPAKLNLFLELHGKRPDGFHEIETVMTPITLFDRLTVRRTESAEIRLHLELPEVRGRPAAREHDSAWKIPGDSSNLVVRAARRIQEELKSSAGCEIHLRKAIPAAAGLAGGSSNAAAVAVACLHLWGGWNRELAVNVCSELGSDISFFLGDESQIGMALAKGRGERLELLSKSTNLEFWVTHPPQGCSTKEVYAGYEYSGNRREAQKIIAACETGQAQKIGAELFNALQFSASRLNEWIARQIELFAAFDLPTALMSGSGSSCFAVVDDQSRWSEFRNLAEQRGLERVYSASVWSTASIEDQLAAARLTTSD